MSHPSLTPAEAERLELLAEEAAEVIQMVMKVLHHGKENFHPDDPLRTTNKVLLSREVGNLNRMVTLCTDYCDLCSKALSEGIHEKSLNLLRYTYHQPFSSKENS